MEEFEERPIEICLSEGVPQCLPDMVLAVAAGGPGLKNPIKLVIQVLDIEQNLFFHQECEFPREEDCGTWEYVSNNVPVPHRAGSYLHRMYVDELGLDVYLVHRWFEVKHGPPYQITVCNDNIGEQLEQLKIQVVDFYGNLCSEANGKLCLTMDLEEAGVLSGDGTTHRYPCPLLSRSTGDLISGVCNFEQFEVGIGVEGIYRMNLSCEISSECVICSPTLHVLITARNIVHSVSDRWRELQRWTQDLEAKAYETSQIREELNFLKDCSTKLQIEIAFLEDDLKHLGEEEGRLQPLHLIDKEILERAELLDLTAQTDEDVRKAIKKLPRSLSSSLDICERSRQNRLRNNAGANTILDMVVMLARVEDISLNSILSRYLGVDNLLQIVCQTRNELQELEVLCQWNGQCGVICLEELSCPDIRIDTEHYQQLLRIPEPTWIDGERPDGFLGFAVNLIHLKPDHLHLRSTLFYHLLGDAQVYATAKDMRNGLTNLWPYGHKAMSLDGSLVTGQHRHQLGRGDPTISFPSLSFAERCQCSLLPPACDAFEGEKRWNNLGKEILRRRMELGSCEHRQMHINIRSQHLESIFNLLTEYQASLQESLLEDLAVDVARRRSAVELIDFTCTVPKEEYRMRIFLVRIVYT